MPTFGLIAECMKVGLIGAGRWAGVHRDALTQLGVDIAGVLVSSDRSVTRVQNDWQLPATTRHGDVFGLCARRGDGGEP